MESRERYTKGSTGCFPHTCTHYTANVYEKDASVGSGKKAKIIPVIKPGKEKVQNASKFRPISLINVGGKVLEKLLINRIMYHIYRNSLLNDNQYGFTRKKSTTDATIAVKGYIEDGFRHGLITILISLDVKGAFDAAWWPIILHTLKDFNCPKNLYRVSQEERT
jgi:hypothetical protein